MNEAQCESPVVGGGTPVGDGEADRVVVNDGHDEDEEVEEGVDAPIDEGDREEGREARVPAAATETE